MYKIYIYIYFLDEFDLRKATCLLSSRHLTAMTPGVMQAIHMWTVTQKLYVVLKFEKKAFLFGSTNLFQ